MYLLFDECVARSLVAMAETLGHTAQRSVEIAALGRGAKDRDIFDFACRFGATIVTINRHDFIELAIESERHPGVILVPSVPTASLRPLFKAVLSASIERFTDGADLFVEIDIAGTITSYRPRRQTEGRR